MPTFRLRFRSVLMALLSCACVVVFAACGSNMPAPGSRSAGGETLTIATEPASAPFEFQAENGELKGFSIDLMNAIGAATGTNIAFESLPFDGIIPALQAGTVDAAISSMTITAERAKSVSFSRPYFKSGLSIAVQNDTTDITSLDSLQGKKIAVQIGTTGETKAKTIENAQVRMFDSAPLALEELDNGGVDAVINDALITDYTLKQGNITGIKVVEGELLTEEFYGIATPKDSPVLATINQGLATLMSNGRYAEIYKTWFEGQPPALPETAPL